MQDGGLMHNNPAKLAEWELRKIWPHHHRPDTVLSLGTGVREPVTTTTIGFLARLWRSFMSSMDGQRAWEDVVNHLDEGEEGSYFRLNVSLDGGDYALDDVDSMEPLRPSVRSQLDNSLACHEVAMALIVPSFFFEVTSVADRPPYRCESVIRCRIPAATI